VRQAPDGKNVSTDGVRSGIGLKIALCSYIATIRLLTEMNAMEESIEAKADASLEGLEAKMDSHHDKFEVLRGTLVSQMDIYQAKTQSTQEEMKAKMHIHQEKMEALVHFLRSELEETIKHWVEDILSCVDQNTQGLHKELTEKIVETQVDLHPIRTSVDTGQRAS
jgi:hypothetical protein